MTYLILTLICLLWLAKVKQFYLNRKNITPKEERFIYTEETIKAIFVEYWKDRMEELESPQEQGQLLYRASKTDSILDQLFHPKSPKLSDEELEAQQVTRSQNVVPLHPQK